MEPQSQKDLLRRHIAVIESLENFKTALEEHIEGCSQQLLELQVCLLVCRCGSFSGSSRANTLALYLKTGRRKRAHESIRIIGR